MDIPVEVTAELVLMDGQTAQRKDLLETRPRRIDHAGGRPDRRKPSAIDRDTCAAQAELGRRRVFEGKLFVIDDFYANVEAIYAFSKICPMRSFKLGYLEGMESVYGYPSESALARIARVLGVREVVDKTNEQSLFGLFRYLLAGEQPDRFTVHADTQPWTMIVYISPTMDAAGTGIYRHRHTGICDLGGLGEVDRGKFLADTIVADEDDQSAWECMWSAPFVQNRAVIFKAGDLLHANIGTWGSDIESCRITQNFNFELR